MALTSALLGLTYGGRAADTWAVGVTLYCMLFGRYPFLGETLQETYDKVSRRRQKPPRHGRRLTFPSDGRFWWVVGWFHFADSQRSLADPWGREPSPERPGWRAPLQRSVPPPPPPGLLDSPRWRLSLSSNRGLSRRSQAAVDPESGGGAPVGRHGRRAGDGDRRGGGSRPAVKRGVRGDLRRAGEDGVWGFISSVVSWWLTLICRGYELESQRLQNGWGRSDSLCRQVFIYLPALIWERERELETRNR